MIKGAFCGRGLLSCGRHESRRKEGMNRDLSKMKQFNGQPGARDSSTRSNLTRLVLLHAPSHVLD